MGDATKIATRYEYQFIHNVFGSFYKSTLDYLTYLYPRFNYTIIGTYDKAVAYLTKKENLEGRELDKPNLPALILNPSGELDTADTGKQFFRYPNISPSWAKRIWEPIYQDQNVVVTVGFSRVKGDIELLMLLNSFYEYCDLRMYLLNIFCGKDRIIFPQYFDSFIILPSEVYEYTYNNSHTGTTYRLDWESCGVTNQLIKSTNQNEWVFPVRIKPWYKLTNMGDASTRYGGIEKLADWRLSCTIEFEVEMPSFIILEENYFANKMVINIKYGSTYSKYSDYCPPEKRDIVRLNYDIGLEDQVNSNTSLSDATSTIETKITVNFKTRYFHIITSDEATSGDDLVITLPEIITNYDLVIINSRYGELKYKDHWDINSNILTIFSSYVSLVSDMVIEIYIYEEE